MTNNNVARLFALLVFSLFSSHSLAQPTFTKAFSPATIGPGSVSVLTFTIDNSERPATNGLAFMDILPGGVTLAAPAFVSSDCLGTLTAPDGGSTITLADGAVGPNSSCKIKVNVTASVVGEGPYSNTSGDLTSSAGNSGTAMADLTVDGNLPGFSKSFAPGSVGFRGRSTLTFTIDNSTSGSAVETLSFQDSLPAGMVVADPANVFTDCENPLSPAMLTAVPGESLISLFSLGSGLAPALEPESTCTVTVDVIGGTLGSLGNVSSELLVTTGGIEKSAGKAAAVLEVTGFEGLLQLTKEFVDDPVPPGGTTTLEFTITNKSRGDAATGITFDDNLETTLSGLMPTLPPIPDPPCGAGSSVSFDSGVLSLTGGSLPAEGSCSFQVELSIPADAVPGAYLNSAGPVSGNVGGSPETGNVANDTLFVVRGLVLTKEFIDNPVGAGGAATLRFTITNTDANTSASEVTFTDDLNTAIAGLAANGLVVADAAVPVPNVCGMGSELTVEDPPDFMTFVIPADPTMLILNNGSLAAAGSPGDSCTFAVMLDVPAGTPDGSYTNTIDSVSALLDDMGVTSTISGPGASGDVVVVGAPQLGKVFTDDPVAPGGTVNLEFTLSHDEFAPGDATGIGFTDDLAALMPAVAGLTAALPPNPDPPCGPGSSLTASAGDTLLTFAGATLAPGEECTFSVTLNVPAGATAGKKNNTTSEVAATVSGVGVTGAAAKDDFLVSGFIISKEFTDDPVIAGGTANLTFTLDNTLGTVDATNITFDDELDDVLSGLAAVAPLPLTPCGGTLTGTSSLAFDNGSVLAGSSCSFDVTVAVPATVPNPPGPAIPPDDTYNNATESQSALLGGTLVVLEPATDTLTVTSNLLQITKQFTDDPVSPGDSVTLEFTLENLSATETVTAIAFSDDLDAALSGLEATGATANTCGGGAVGMPVFPTSFFDYANGTLGPGATCNITLTVDVPSAPLPAGPYINTTSDITGKVGTLDVAGDPATDELAIQLLNLTKSFDGPTTATGTAVLTFTITNLDSVNDATGLSFSDNLGAVLPGLVATSLPSVPCGAGSNLAGSDFLTLSNASLVPGGACSFDVTVTAPATATAGTFPNTSGDLRSNGLPVAGPASASLTIEPAPTFNKGIIPNVITAGASTTITFTIDNTASALAATGLDFSDNFPAGMVVASPANASTTCTGGTLTAVAGAGVFSYSGGTVGASTSCTVQVDATSTSANVYVNTTGDLTSSAGNSGTAADTLTVNANAAPLFSKSFAPNTITAGTTTTLTFTIDNTASTLAASGLDFTDTFPADMVVASPANASTTCTGGTLTAVAGAGVFSYSGGTVGAGTSCTVRVDATSTLANIYVNTTGDLTSSAGNSGTAADTLTVTPVVVVTSFTGPLPSTNTGTLSFATEDSGCTFAGDPVFSLPVSTPPPGVELVDGVIGFTVTGCTPGATVTFMMNYGAAVDSEARYWKEGTPWFLLPGAMVAGSTITFSITDGGIGDADGTANGTIVDPGGAALGSPAPAEPIPAMSQLGLWLLAGLMLLAGLLAHRRLGYS